MAGEKDRPTALGDMVPLLIRNIESLYKGEGGVLGLATGFHDLDYMTGGIQKGYMAIGSRPCLGKTAMAMAIALNMARAGHKGAYVMPSMSAHFFSHRMLALVSGISIFKLSTGLIKPSDMSLLVKAADEMTSLPILLVDGEELIDEIVDELRSLAKDSGIEWAVIDSLDCVRGHDESKSPDEWAREVSGKLKIVQKELDLPIIPLFQLSTSKADTPSSLRGCGPMSEAVKRDADAIILLERSKGGERNKDGMLGAQFIIAKNKGGPVGSIEMLFDPKTPRFCELG